MASGLRGWGLGLRVVSSGLRSKGPRAEGLRGLASPAAGGVVISPAAGLIIANNPQLKVEELVSKATSSSPGGTKILSKADVLVALGLAPASSLPQATAAPKAAAAPQPQAPSPAAPQPEVTPAEPAGVVRRNLTHKSHRTHEDIPASQIRKVIAKRLLESKMTTAHSYMAVEVEMDNLIATRVQFNEAHGVKVSVNDFVIKAVASALRQVPEANAYWTEDAIKFNKSIDVAFAAATPAGLVTPVVKDAAIKSIVQIAAETKDMAGRARNNKLMPEEYQGGCTSVSNLGMFDISEFIAVLNPPQSTIFAVGSTVAKAVPDGKGGIESRNVMRVSVSHDARVVDEAVAEKLCGTFKNLIEKPALIFM